MSDKLEANLHHILQLLAFLMEDIEVPSVLCVLQLKQNYKTGWILPGFRHKLAAVAKPSCHVLHLAYMVFINVSMFSNLKLVKML